MPFDQTRVPLPTMKDDYINASFVNELSSTAYPFITTQAPLHETMEDFWQMIWQDDCHAIVMLTRLVEGVREKCFQYWPALKGSKALGQYIITNVEEHELSGHVERYFDVTDGQVGLRTNRDTLRKNDSLQRTVDHATSYPAALHRLA